MKILSRYVFKEFAVPLAYCLAGFTGIYVLFELFGSFSRIADAKLPWATVARYLAGYVSPYFHYLAPAALMLATIYTMWNLCRHSELTAMRASGVSLAVAARPVLFAAALLAGAVAWVNECYKPANALWATRLRNARFDAEAARRDRGFSYSNSASGRLWTVEGGHDALCRRLEGVRVALNRPDGTRKATVTADFARHLDGEWWFSNPKVRYYDASERPCPSPLPEADALTLRMFPQLDERPEDMALQGTDVTYSSTAGKFRQIARNPDLSDESRRNLLYDAWAQAVSPLACIIVTLFSIPAGIASGRQSVFSGVLGAMGLFVLYYGLMVGCMILAKSSLVPPVPAALAPPVVFGAIGVFRCFRPLAPTFAFTAALFALFGAYAVAANALASKAGVEISMAHALGATLPALAAVAAAFRIGRGAPRV